MFVDKINFFYHYTNRQTYQLEVLKLAVRNIHKDLSPVKKKGPAVKRIKDISSKNVYYFFLTLGLIICLFQSIRGASLNVLKYINLNSKFHELKTLNTEAKERNDQLREQLKDYTSSKGIEALARDTLKMVGKNEVLVLVKDAPKPVKKQ